MRVLNSVECDHRVGNPIRGYILEDCPRCLGKGRYGGISYSVSGKIQTVSNEKGLVQKIQKILTEKKRTSTGYGFDHDLLVSLTDGQESVVVYEVIRCLEYLIYLQELEKRNGVVFNPSEEISKVGKVRVEKDASDPRAFTVFIEVLTKTNTAVSLIHEF